MSFHLYTLNELYSNADGSVQFIELFVGSSGVAEGFWQGISITATSSQGGATHSYTFPSNLPNPTATANHSVLIATQGFANLGLVIPDFLVPAGFLYANGGTVNFAGVNSITYTSLPTDGTHSINASKVVINNSPTNFAGSTGAITAVNHAPTLANPLADRSTAEDAAFSFVLPANTFADSDAGDTLAYSASRSDGTALPAWLGFNTGTRTFSGTPANADVGVLNLRVTARDSANATVNDDFALAITNVNDAPVAASYANRFASAGKPVSLDVGSVFSDVDSGDSLSFGATGLPAGLVINSASGAITGTVPATTGVFHVAVTATDTHAATVSLNFDLSIISSGTVSANVVTRDGLALPGVTVHELFSIPAPDSVVGLSFERGTADYLINGTSKPITAADALDALKLSVGLAASKGSSWKELIAADVNHSGSVTAADALEILKISVGLNAIQPSWVFVPTDAGNNPNLATMTRSAVSYKGDVDLSVVSAPDAVSVTGILLGDVNNSWLIPV